MLSPVCLRLKNVLIVTTILLTLSACNLNSKNLQLSLLNNLRQAPEVKNGLVQVFDTSGKLKCCGRFLNNLPVGFHQYYTPQGHLVSEKVFIQGKLIDYKIYRQFVPFAKAKFLPVCRTGYLKYKDGLKPMQEINLPDNLLQIRKNAGWLEIYLTNNGGFKLLSKTQLAALADKAQL